MMRMAGAVRVIVSMLVRMAMSVIMIAISFVVMRVGMRMAICESTPRMHIRPVDRHYV